MTTSLEKNQSEMLIHLVTLRTAARRVIKAQKLRRDYLKQYKSILDSAIRKGDLKTESLTKIDMATLRESLLKTKFQIIELGNAFMHFSKECDRILPREVWLRALSVNESEWNTEAMRKYGETMVKVVCVLNLENSATKGDAIEHKPLQWCAQMAMFNLMDTNAKFGEIMHDRLNEVIDGAFGEWKEPSLMQRLGIKS